MFKRNYTIACHCEALAEAIQTYSIWIAASGRALLAMTEFDYYEVNNAF